MEPLALYIHWPFCLAKCPYCDFNSHVRERIPQARFRAALRTELAWEAARLGRRRLTSVFFGGGTPSLMEPETVAVLLEDAGRLFAPADDIEITLEANPTSVEAASLAGFRAAGVNRVSLGVQSLDPEALARLGRQHSADQAIAALEIARRIFPRISFDLIYARPGQTPAQWNAELTRALALGTGHLSLYQLTIEPGTRFATLVRDGSLSPLADDPAAELFALTRAMTDAVGLPAYEVSNHARADEQSRHNLAYWRYRDYLGVGPGAHGRRGGFATLRHKKPENWLEAVARRGNGLHSETALDRNEQAAEALLMGLRLAEGIDLGEIGTRFGYSPDALIVPDKVAFYARLGLIEHGGGRLTVTPKGMPLLDGLLAELVAPALVAA